MLEELYKYNFVKKTKSELESDRILNDISKKLWDNAGYVAVHNPGAVNQLKSIAQAIKKHGPLDLDTVLKAISLFKDSEGVSDLVDMILEEFDYKESQND